MSKSEIKTPVFPESVVNGLLTVWNKKVGDSVQRYEIIANIETDKVVFEVVSPDAGVITEILVEVNQEVVSEQLLAFVDTSAAVAEPAAKPAQDNIAAKKIEEPATTSHEAAPAAHQNIDLSEFSPSMRRKLRGLNNLEAVLNADLIPAAPAPSNQAAPVVIDPSLKPPQVNRKNTVRNPIKEPLSPLRRALSQNLLSVQERTALLTTFNEVDFSNLAKLRKDFNQQIEDVYGIKLGYMSFFVKAVSRALEHYPIIGAKLINNQVIKYNTQNISIAVATEKGLFAPVIRDVQSLELVEIELAIKELALKARDQLLELHEMQDGDFTITNGGVFGSYFSTPIINGDQSAILGMHSIKDRPVAVDGKVEIRPIMLIALSYDHCLIDGQQAVLFLAKIKEYIENPVKLTLGL